MGTYSKLCEWCGLYQQIVPIAKYAGIDDAGIAIGAAPCSKRGDAKQPGLSYIRAVCLAERTCSARPCIEVRPLFQRDCWLPVLSSYIYEHLHHTVIYIKVVFQFFIT